MVLTYLLGFWYRWRARIKYAGRHHIQRVQHYVNETNRGELTPHRIPTQPTAPQIRTTLVPHIMANAHRRAKELGRRRHAR